MPARLPGDPAPDDPDPVTRGVLHHDVHVEAIGDAVVHFVEARAGLPLPLTAPCNTFLTGLVGIAPMGLILILAIGAQNGVLLRQGVAGLA